MGGGFQVSKTPFPLDSPLPMSITTPNVATLDGVYTCIGIGGGIHYYFV